MENEELYKRLDVLCAELKDNNINYNSIGKVVSSQKNELKEIFEKLNINKYDGDNFSISITNIDKTTLDEVRTIDYLKKNGLEKYIKVKEYIDPNELIVASQKGELKVEDLQQFMVEKIEKRINIK